MDATKFIAVSKASKDALKTATLLRSLKVNALIKGEIGVGKKTLASYIMPSAIAIEARKYEELLSVLQSSNEVIIVDLESVANIKVVIEMIKKNNLRVIATASPNYTNKEIEDFFGINFTIPPLKERPEDVAALVKKFKDDIGSILNETISIDEKFIPELSKNAISLKKQIFVYSIFKDLDEENLIELIYRYLYDKLGSNNDYKKFLHLYEAPLIKAGLKRFKSQLQLADKLGVNRNTLRKKIHQNKEYLDE